MAEPDPAGETRRRRWIGFGEALGLAAVVISGLTLWNNYQERTGAEAARAAEKRASAAEKRAASEADAARAQTLLLKASGGGASLKLVPLDAAQAIQSQTLAFPAALKAERIDTVIDPRIEAEWIERALRDAPQPKSGSGDRSLPVAITTRFLSGGETRQDTALYDVGYRIDADLLDRDLELIGLSLIERVPEGEAQRRLDTIWNKRAG